MRWLRQGKGLVIAIVTLVAGVAAFLGNVDKIREFFGLKKKEAELVLSSGKVEYMTRDGRFVHYIVHYEIIKRVDEALDKCNFRAWLAGAETRVDGPKDFSLSYGKIRQQTVINVYDSPSRKGPDHALVSLVCAGGSSESDRFAVPPLL